MRTSFFINLSEKKFSPVFFENLKNNPSEYFMKIRRMILDKELSGIIQFNIELNLYQAVKANNLKVEFSQRRGYKVVEFYC